jgi:WD40 repeat protein
MALSWVLAVVGNGGQVGSAQGQPWQEVSCPPTQPFTFCAFKDHTVDVGFFSVVFSPDGKLLATTDDEAEPTQGLIRLWDTNQGTVIRTITSICCPLDIVFSPDGKLLASATGTVFGDNSVKLWDVATGELARQLTGHTQLLYQVAFSPDGKTLDYSSK